MGTGKLKKLMLGLLGLIFVVIGVGWYLSESFPNIGNLTNLESLGIMIQGFVGIGIIILGIILIIIAKE